MSELKNKQCPICGEYIPIEAQECEYCGEKFVQEDTIPQEELPKDETSPEDSADSDNENDETDIETYSGSNPLKVKWIVAFIVALIVFVGLILFGLAKIHDGIDLSFGSLSSKSIHKPSIPKSISVSHKSNKNIDKARELYKNKNTDAAAELFQAEVDSNNNPVANYYMGEIYNDQGYRKIAISYYKAADAAKKDFYEPKKRLAQIYWDIDENDLAMNYAQSAYKIKQKDIELLNLLASMYKYTEDENKLIDIYRKILKIQPKNYDANYYLANYYYKKNDYKTAAVHLANILSDNYNTDIAYGLVMCYVKVEYYTNAIEILNKIIANDPYEYYSATNLKNRVKELREGYKREHNRSNVTDLEERVEDALF